MTSPTTESVSPWFVFSLVALSKIVSLEKQLRDGGVLDKTDRSQ